MEKISGLVLDVYDDRSGDVLREVFPTPEDLPGLVKTAHAVTEEERRALPDDAFALVLVNDDQELKKYATIDAGNTALSVEYFLKTGHKLPVEAQKVAATNLLAACGWYGIEPPELLKEAGLGTALYNVGSLGKAAIKSPDVRRELGRQATSAVHAATKPARRGGSPSITQSLKKLDRSAGNLAKKLGREPQSSRQIIEEASKAGKRKKASVEKEAVKKLMPVRKFKAGLQDSSAVDRLRTTSSAERRMDTLAEEARKRLGMKALPDTLGKKSLPIPKQASVEKLALNLRKMKKNLDKAPERPPMIPGLKKEAVSRKGVKALVDKAEASPQRLAQFSRKMEDSYQRVLQSALDAPRGSKDRQVRGMRAATRAVAAETAKKRALGIKTSSVDKVAFGVGTALGALGMATQMGTVKKNLGAVKGTRQILTPQQIARRAGTGV